jgi:23S rRNA G2445 N2-methylase RlmL
LVIYSSPTRKPEACRKLKKDKINAAKELYKQLRHLSWNELWSGKVPAYNAADAVTRASQAALVRAVGVVFFESGPPSLRAEVTAWLRDQLRDPDEKIRRYAMAALPKTGAEQADEEALIGLLENSNPPEREKKYLSRALDKIGGKATLEVIDKLSSQTAMKVKAGIAREESPAEILLESLVPEFPELPIHLRCRRGLEVFVRNELESSPQASALFSIHSTHPGLVKLLPRAAFRLRDILSLRCFATFSLVLGTLPAAEPEAVAALVAAPRTRDLLHALTRGASRYRLEWIGQGHRRGWVREVAQRAFELCPEILNDPRHAPWAIEVYPAAERFSVELRPRLSPDPRFAYRRRDVPAASHPPLAACLARLAGNSGHDLVWDPFCGSGLELIERARLGGVTRIFGSDLSAEALEIARSNFAAADLGISPTFQKCDFRDARFEPGSLSQILTNPPMGRRVPIPNLPDLIRDLFAISARLLRPGGCLVFANPLPIKNTNPLLRLHSSQRIDMGGFDCMVECHIKQKR